MTNNFSIIKKITTFAVNYNYINMRRVLKNESSRAKERLRIAKQYGKISDFLFDWKMHELQMSVDKKNNLDEQYD